MAFELKLLSGSSHPELARKLAAELGIELEPVKIEKFSCGEIYVQPQSSLRGHDVFIVQTGTQNSNEDLMELFLLIDSVKRSFAGKVHVVMPHLPYARQDRVAAKREPISAKLVADLLEASGADHVICVDLHSEQIQGFFDRPMDSIKAQPLFVKYFMDKHPGDIVVVAPDAGGAKNAKRFADVIGAELAIMNKTRPGMNQSEVTHLVGNVCGKHCIVYDDMVDTAGSVSGAAKFLRAHGADKEVYLAATHAVFSGPAYERLLEADFTEIVVTDSLPIKHQEKLPNLKVLSLAPLLSKIIFNIHEGFSVSEAMEN
jgi:ribose-phosphate pyrophosphokinase